MIGAPTNLDFEIVVTDVADRAQRKWGVVVTAAARGALLKPAREHQQQIEEELSEGRITLEFLEDSIEKVLSVAHAISRDELKDRRKKTRQGEERRKKVRGQTIEERHVLESMKKDCPYIPWC